MQSFSFKACLSLCKNFYLLFAIVFVLFIAWHNRPDFKIVATHLQTISVGIILLGLLCALVSYIFRSMRWLAYLRLIEKKASSALHTLIYLSGFSFTASPGKVGELMRGSYLSDLGVPFKYTFCSFLSERLLDVIVVMMLGSYFLILHFSNKFILLFLLMTILPLIAALAFKLLTRIINTEKIITLITILSSLWQIKLAIQSTVFTLVAWISQGFILYLILNELGVHISIPIAVSLYCLSLLIGAASLIPAGIGATELGMAWLLTQVGVDNDIALSSSLLTRMLTLWPAITIGVISSFLLRKQRSL